MKTLKYTITLENKRSSNFLIISDTHVENIGDNSILNTIIKEIEKASITYDAIFFLGDLIDNTRVLNDSCLTIDILNFLKALSAIAPLYIVKGNHDICSLRKDNHFKRWVIDETKYEEKILKPLKKEKAIYAQQGVYNLNDKVSIIIYNPPSKYIKCPQQKRERVLKEDYENYKSLFSLDADKLNILLCHYPDVLKWFHKEKLLSCVDLAISGHNHGGMTQNVLIETFFNLFNQKNRGIITPDKSIKLSDTKNIRGLIKLDETTRLYINPAITSLAPNTSILKNLNFIFYRGLTSITIKTKMIKRSRKSVEK